MRTRRASSLASRLRDRHHRSAPVRRLRRASRPLRLWRHLRARPSRPPTSKGFRRDVLALVRELGADHHALSRRQLRLRLQLGGRRRPGRAAAAPARSRLDVDRDQPVRHQRVHRLVPRRRHRADAGGQPRHARRRCGAQPGRVLQPPRRHGAVRPAPHARLGQAARREVLVPRQRDGWAVADGGQDRDRVRPHRARRRPR